MNEEIRNPEQLPPAGQVSHERYFIAVPQPAYDEDEISLRDYWKVVARYRWIILLVVVLCTGAATTYALLATPVYEASVLLAPVNSDNNKGALSSLAAQYGGLASMVGINLGGGGSSTDEAIATLKSRAFTDQFIKDYNLLPVLFAEKWDPQAKKWHVDSPAGVPTMGDAYRLFNNTIRRVSQDTSTGLVTVSIDWTNRKQAAEWANELVQRVNQRMRDRAISEAHRSIDYLKKELAGTSVVDLQQGIYQLIETQVKKAMLANVRKEYSFRIVDPATVPDADQRVKPRRRLLVTGGALAGLFLGLLVAFVFDFFRRMREHASTG